MAKGLDLYTALLVMRQGVENWLDYLYDVTTEENNRKEEIEMFEEADKVVMSLIRSMEWKKQRRTG